MNKNHRLKEIVNVLRAQNFVKISDLKERLNVSEMTVRRDLSMLAADRIVKLVPGGAIPTPPNDSTEDHYVVTQHETLRVREKLSIGQRAAALIEPRDTVIVDIGSTTEYVAKFTREDYDVTVLCYTLNVLFEMYRKKNCRIIFPGGYFHCDELMFESPEGVSLIRRTRADKAFISAAGVHHQLGVTTVYPYELELKRAAMQSAKTKILVVDSSKFGKTRSVYFADISNFDIVVTDSNISEQYAEIIRSSGAKLIIA